MLRIVLEIDIASSFADGRRSEVDRLGTFGKTREAGETGDREGESASLLTLSERGNWGTGGIGGRIESGDRSGWLSR